MLRNGFFTESSQNTGPEAPGLVTAIHVMKSFFTESSQNTGPEARIITWAVPRYESFFSESPQNTGPEARIITWNAFLRKQLFFLLLKTHSTL